jgi:spore germination protein KB
MMIEKGKISSSQLLFLVLGMVQGSTLTLAFVNQITRQNTWIVTLTGLIATLPLAIVYTALSNKFPGRNLIEINERVYGAYLGKFISIMYLSYFFLIVPYNLRFMGDFLTSFLFPETPMIVFIILFALLCSWAVRSGIEVIARCSPFLVIISFVVTAVTILLLLNVIKLSNLLPIFDLNLKQAIQGTHIMVAIPFGEVIVFLMINSNTNNIKQIKKTTLLGLVIGAIYMIFIAIRSTTVLGILNLNQVSPAYQAVRSINVADVLTRLESLITLTLLITIFIKICLFYYASVLGIAEVLKLRTYKPLVTPIGIIMISLSILIYDNALEISVIAANIYPAFVIPIQIFIPVVTLILTGKRKQII